MTLENILDAKHLQGADGCALLIYVNEEFSREQKHVVSMAREKHSRKNVRSALSFMKASIDYDNPQDNELALIEFIRICEIYSTYFDIEAPITPYQFISWAKDRDSFSVPRPLLDWYAKKREKRQRGNNIQKQEIASPPVEAQGASLDQRQETTYKVLLATLLAHAGKYPWGERGGKAAVVKWLARELQSLGCAMSEKTIGKHLDGLSDAIRKKEIAPISKK